LFEYKVAGEVLIAFETEFRRDERVMRLTVSLDKHAILGLKEEEQNLNLKKLNYHGNITTIFRKKRRRYQISYSLNIETNKQKNTVVSKNQESNTSIIKMVISY
jgi:hypothetical protein